MNWIKEIYCWNYLLSVSLTAWLIAQVLKTIINFILMGKFRVERMWGSGGMPSAHSAVSCSVTMSALLNYGFSSPIFAVAFILTLIVIYDATGVRWEAGMHARTLNLLIDRVEAKLPEEERAAFREEFPELNESLGHRPIEAVFGSLLGIAIAALLQLAYG